MGNSLCKTRVKNVYTLTKKYLNTSKSICISNTLPQCVFVFVTAVYLNDCQIQIKVFDLLPDTPTHTHTLTQTQKDIKIVSYIA